MTSIPQRPTWRLDTRAPAVPQPLAALAATLERQRRTGDPAYSTTLAELRARVVPILAETAFARRAIEKPAGYAGDAETIELIYDGPPPTAAGLGATVDAELLALPAAQAVRNRRMLLAHHVDVVLDRFGSSTRITSLASGPARELLDVFARRAERPELILADIDREALARAEGRLRALGFGPNLRTVQIDLRRPERLHLKPQHLIYSAGLVDYFDDRQVKALMAHTYGLLAPGGHMVLGNFAPSNPTRAVMDEILDWRLVYRDAHDLRRLMADSPFGQAEAVSAEPLGINLFAIGRRRQS